MKKQSKEISRKAQLTMFIILGLVVLFAVAFMIYIAALK